VRRIAGLVVVLGLLASVACGAKNDIEVLNRGVRSSDTRAREFRYHSVTENQDVAVRGKVEDELRYAMVMSSGGKDLVDYVVRDDAIGVRLRDPSFGKRLANTLGDGVVDAALKSGEWVVDPSGAPPLIRPEVAQGADLFGDPFRDAYEIFRYVKTSVSQARDVKLFSLEDIEYRSSQDPWRYPTNDSEARYDLVRPRLPTSEGQTIGSRGDIGPNVFRKMSVFLKADKVEQLCSLVDIEGHEKIKELREKGLSSNPFLANLLKRVENKETSTPIEERYLVTDFTYPNTVEVKLPTQRTVGKLETFITALQKGIEAGALRPRTAADTSECKRPPSEDSK
jgi:hypothetical protein